MNRFLRLITGIKNRLTALFRRSRSRGSGELAKRSLRGELIRMFLIAAGMTLFVGLAGYRQVTAVRSILTERTTIHSNARHYAVRLENAINQASNLVIEYAIGTFEHERLRKDFVQADTDIRTILQELEQWTELTVEERNARESIEIACTEFLSAGNTLVTAKGELEAANQNLNNDAAEFGPIRDELEVLVLDQGYPMLEVSYWQMAYHEASFVGTSHVFETLQALNVDVTAFRILLLGLLQEYQPAPQAVTLLDDYAITLDQMITDLHRQESRLADQVAALQDFSDKQDGLLVNTRALVDLEAGRLTAAQDLADDRVQNTIVVLLGLVVVAEVIGLGLGVFNAERITRPLKDLAAVATDIAGGALQRKVAVEREDEIGALARAFNSMTVQLRNLIGSLEQQVAERTADLERRSAQLQTAADVGQVIVSILETDRLMEQVVRLIQSRFDFYHTALFMIDPTLQWIEYCAGVSRMGPGAFDVGWRLQIGGRSMIGSCAAEGRVRVAQDVSQEPDYMPFDRVPDTQSEAVLPLIARGQVIGVLDLESDQLNAFDQDMLVVLETMAGQVAVALDNARLFAESQHALEAERRALGEMQRQSWQKILLARPDVGYVYDAKGTVDVTADSWQADMIQAGHTGQIVQGDDGALAVPVESREQVVGVLRLRKPEQAGVWTGEEIELMQELAEQLGVALEGAHLYQQTQRRAAREQLVTDITGLVRASLDPDKILKVALRELGRVLPVEWASIEIVAPGRDDSISPGEDE